MKKTIKIQAETHKRLTAHGQFNDSFDDIINRILDVYEKKKTTKKK